MNRYKLIFFSVILLLCLHGGHVLAEERADALYRKGRFAEAEKAYAAADMDHPKDVRYRYNRGCAAYQQGNYQGALAAFSSVLRRTEDSRMRFRAAYNLGNTAFKLGDFAAAAEYFKQAILMNPEDEDVKHNLELSLRELDRRKNEKNQEQDPQAEGEGGQGKRQEERKDQGKGGKEPGNDEEPGQEKKDRESPSQKDPKAETPQAHKEEGSGNKDKGQGEAGQQERQSPPDLQGDLRPLQEFREEEGKGQEEGAGMSAIDRNKAETLLDNVKEDRSRFLRLQVPPEKRGGVSSGKDW